MLNLSLAVKTMKLFFISGFIMSFFGAALGIVRILGELKVFESIKPELRQFSPEILTAVKRSFYRPQHWLTMLWEMINLETSGKQLMPANNLENLPVVVVKAEHFFKPSLFNFFLLLNKVDKLRDRIAEKLLKISTNTSSIDARNSSHFVWIDRRDAIVAAVERLIAMDGRAANPNS